MHNWGEATVGEALRRLRAADELVGRWVVGWFPIAQASDLVACDAGMHTCDASIQHGLREASGTEAQNVGSIVKLLVHNDEYARCIISFGFSIPGRSRRSLARPYMRVLRRRSSRTNSVYTTLPATALSSTPTKYAESGRQGRRTRMQKTSRILQLMDPCTPQGVRVS